VNDRTRNWVLFIVFAAMMAAAALGVFLVVRP
jgi:hypothetical protein